MAGLNSWLIDPEPARRNTVTVMNETPTDKNSRRKNKSFKVNLNKLNDEKIFGKQEVQRFQSKYMQNNKKTTNKAQ